MCVWISLPLARVSECIDQMWNNAPYTKENQNGCCREQSNDKTHVRNFLKSLKRRRRRLSTRKYIGW